MPAEPVENFLDADFVEQAARTLDEVGFITDEHPFAPYRETLSERVGPIRLALLEAGYDIALRNGFVKHPEAGFAYFVFDEERFKDHAEASTAVAAWLDERYASQ